jgi:hypothetical protein
MSLGGGKNTRSFRQAQLGQRRLGAMADETGLGFDIGFMIHLGVFVRKLYFTAFVVNSDVFELFFPGDIFNDQGDIVSQIVHHGVMQTESDGVGQSIGTFKNTLHGLFLLVVDIKVGPYRYAQQQDKPHQDGQFVYNASIEIINKFKHF